MDFALNLNYSYALLNVFYKNSSNHYDDLDSNYKKSKQFIKKCDKIIIESNQRNFIYYSLCLLSLSILVGIFFHWKFSTFKTANKDNIFRPFRDLLNIFKEIHSKYCDYVQTVFTTACFFLFIALLPLLLMLWICILIYRQIIFYIIKKKYSKTFCGFLDGADALWALEDESARSVINIMVLIEIDPKNANDGPNNVLLTLRKRLSSRFLGEYKPFPKLFYRRCQEYGYSFWTNDLNCSIEDYIRFMPDIIASEKTEDDKTYIECAFGILSNMPLPQEHSALWEALVSKKLIKDQISDFGQPCHYIPVLFRIHHAVGDGVALLRLFLETIADREQPKKKLWSYCFQNRDNIKERLMTNVSENNLATNLSSWKNAFQIDSKSIVHKFKRMKIYAKILIRRIQILMTSPAAIVYQAAFKKIDKNSLHKATLSGKKLLCWRFETDEDDGLLGTMKMIKRYYLGVRFSDVLLAALSISLQNYFESKGKRIPNSMTVVLPARIEAEQTQLKLQNKFSVALQTLPIRSGSRLASKSSQFHSKMLEVKKYSDELRKWPDYYVNYWIMSFLTALLPANILATLTKSIHSTVVVSNLPGPQTVSYINGYRINNLGFWIPHRGSTGIGISILSYGNKLHLGLIADRRVLSNRKDAQDILDNTVEQIKEMSLVTKQKTKRCSAGDIMNFY